MPKVSETFLVKRCAERISLEEIDRIPDYTRGIYALLKQGRKGNKVYYNVVYVGMGVDTGIKSRLRNHAKTKTKWTHFSIL